MHGTHTLPQLDLCQARKSAQNPLQDWQGGAQSLRPRLFPHSGTTWCDQTFAEIPFGPINRNFALLDCRSLAYNPKSVLLLLLADAAVSQGRTGPNSTLCLCELLLSGRGVRALLAIGRGGEASVLLPLESLSEGGADW